MSETTNNRTIIVTGLPRSGTSMMMKMLDAGGVPPLTDGERTADSDNPNGYYEFEPVKQTRQDATWLQRAAGRAVKMVYSLVYDLPADRTYDVVFMRRDLAEILASQKRMLQNMGTPSEIDDGRMAGLFEREIHRFQQWLADADHIRCLEVSYSDVAAGRSEPLEQLSCFLGGDLDVSAMEAVADPSLYRNRATSAAA